MKKTAINIVIILLSSLLLLFLGMVFTGDLFGLLLPKVHQATYQANGVGGGFWFFFFLSFIVALIPLLLFITWRVTPIAKTSQKFVSIGLVLAFGFIAVMLRRLIIILELKNLVARNNINGVQYSGSFLFEKLYFEYYLLAGIVAGCILSYIIYRNKILVQKR